MNRFLTTIAIAAMLFGSTAFAAPSQGVVTKATEDLLAAVSGKPGMDANSPARPEMSLELKRGVAKELWDNPTIQASYDHLAASRRDYDWFRAIEELEESRASWCLASGLCHPSSSVRVKCAQALSRLRSPEPAPFVLEVADAFAVNQQGEGAANNAQFQHALASLLNNYTGLTINLKEGQDAEALRAALPAWKRALRERSGPIIRTDKSKNAIAAAKAQLATVVIRVVLVPKPEGQWDPDFTLTKAVLSVPALNMEAPAPGPSGKPDLIAAKITQDQAALLIDALADGLFFDRAQPSRPDRTDRHAFIELTYGEGESSATYCLASPWNASVIEMINPVCTSVDGEACKSLRQLLTPLHVQLQKSDKSATSAGK